jgi:hypothetical protein
MDLPKEKQAPAKGATAPAEGERRAQRGYTKQYDAAAAAIYSELIRGEIQWIGLAYKAAGMLDDLVLGYENYLVAHQFKSSRYPEHFNIETFLLGADGLLKPAVDSWRKLKDSHAGLLVKINLVTNDYPSTNGRLGADEGSHSAALIADIESHPQRTIAEWKATRWKPFFERLFAACELNEAEFSEFWEALTILAGPAADFAQLHKLTPDGIRQAHDIAKQIPHLVAGRSDQDRWTRKEFLDALGWRDPSSTIHAHVFPLGAHVQRNKASEKELRSAISGVTSGYIALLGPPGAGKSTLLQMSLVAEKGIRIVRYLAYVPGAAQGVGRGEAEHFLTDVCAQLSKAGLQGPRFRNETQIERRQQFEEMIRRANQRYEKEGIRTLIVVDGLDHIPREEFPQQSLLTELPLPSAVPDGIIFVLGSQTLDLQHLRPAVRDQASQAGRRITIAALDRDGVRRMADASGLDAGISRARLFERSQGHPLVTRYLIASLQAAPQHDRAALLEDAMTFTGDIEAVYASAWRGIETDTDARHVLAYLARAEGPMPLELLTEAVLERAIENALKATRHLLIESPKGWTIFHNSFRLFILSKPQLRFGKDVADFSRDIYRSLADLARQAAGATPQRWLELRYAARAEEHQRVLDLALPQRFRDQFADGRRIEDLYADVRLALISAKSIYDPVAVIQLLIIHDEIGRRSQALEYARSLPGAYLAVGDVDAAEALVQMFPEEGYDVVDALIDCGQMERAKRLFDRLDPLPRTLEGEFEHRHTNDRITEFEKWAGYAPYFRDHDQILETIENFCALDFELSGQEDKADFPERLGGYLRFRLVESICKCQGSCNVQELIGQYALLDATLAGLALQAGLGATVRSETDAAIAQFEIAISAPGFSDTANDLRIQMTTWLLKVGREDLAAAAFAGLRPPSLEDFGDQYESSLPRDTTGAIVEYARAATRLRAPIPEIRPTVSSLLKPIQAHATEIGRLLGKLDLDESAITAGDVGLCAVALLRYLSRSTSSGGIDLRDMHHLILAAPVLGEYLIGLAARCGDGAVESVLEELDALTESGSPHSALTTGLRRAVAVSIFTETGDRETASLRLGELPALLLENTPEMQVDGLAVLATAFAKVGEVERAKELLAGVRTQTLGYALAAKKDPLYITWQEVLKAANAADPGGHRQRVCLMVRQLVGMDRTEGSGAAGRLSFEVIRQGALHSAGFGLAVGKELSSLGMLGWANVLDCILRGLVERNPTLAMETASIWCHVALPHYIEPYYRSPSAIGGFADAVLDHCTFAQVQELALLLSNAVEVNSRAHERLHLLKRIERAAGRRGVSIERVSDAIARWSLEQPEERHSHTPQKYDGCQNLPELGRALNADLQSGTVGYEASSAYERLAPIGNFNDARELFERVPSIGSAARCRFVLFDLAFKAGQKEYARKLVEEYAEGSDTYSSWTPYFGGMYLQHTRARILLGDPKACRDGYQHFITSFLAGKENANFLLAEIEDLIPAIAETPNWPAIWSLFAEQIAATREFQIGAVFDPNDVEADDLEGLAAIVYWAYQIPISELRRQAQLAVLEVMQMPNGKAFAEHLVIKLLEGQGDNPAHGMQLLLLDTHDVLKGRIDQQVAEVLDHEDFAVGEMAATIARRWGLSRTMTRVDLPTFYRFELGGALVGFAIDAADRESEMELLESFRAWVAIYERLMNMLACAEADRDQIETRIEMFIQSWGGVKKWGAGGDAKVRSLLRRLELQVPFEKPRVEVAGRAIRYVAGELRRAGLVDPKAVPFLLYKMDFVGAPIPPYRASPRPRFISRPLLPKESYRDEEVARSWLESVAPHALNEVVGEEYVLAELSFFEIRKANWAVYRAERFHIPRLDRLGDRGFVEWMEEIPAAYWIDGAVVAIDKVPAPTIVRLFSTHYMRSIPSKRLVLCPLVLKDLGWSASDDSQATYVDDHGNQTARIVWWRDGGQVDINDDVVWGEGMVVYLTRVGKTQLDAKGYGFAMTSHEFRSANLVQGESKTLTRAVHSSR